MSNTDDDYVINPSTGRKVKKSGPLGRKILAGMIPEKKRSNGSRTRRTRETPPRPNHISLGDETGLMCISLVTRQGHWSGVRLAHFVDGMQAVKSALSECHPEHVDTIERICLLILGTVVLLRRRSKSVTLGCLASTNWTTWTDKSIFSDNTTLITNLLRMLPRACLGRDRVSLPYWTSQYEEWSQKLWCPSEIVSPGWAVSSLKESWDSEDAVSWFTTKQKTRPQLSDSSTMSSVSCMYTLAGLMEAEGEPLPNLQETKNKESTRQVRLFPPEPVANILLSWLVCARVNYNKSLYHRNTTGVVASEFDLREMFVNESIVTREQLPVYRVNNGYMANYHLPLCGGYTKEVLRGNRKLKGKILSKVPNENIKPWMKDIPKEVRHSGVKDYVKAREACIANLKAGNIRRFKMTYRKKGDRKYPSVNVGNKFTIEENGKYLRMFPQKLAATRGVRNKNKKNPSGKTSGRILVASDSREFLVDVAKDGFKECRLKYEGGQWFLMVSYTEQISAPEHSEIRGVAACDPGARTFLTVYDGDNVVAVQQDRNQVKRLQAKLDMLRSLRSNRTITTRSFVRGRRRIRRKRDNLMKDLHYKVSSDLVSSYEAFGLPSFNTGDMVKGGLAKITKRELLGLQHGKFRTRFHHKARGRTHVLPESFTSMTCTQCGTIRKIGGLEIYHCRNCNLTIGRDTGSARSIFMCLMMCRWERK